VAEGLGQRVASLRAERGVTVRELAALTSIPHAELLALENSPGRSLPAENLQRLASFFHTTAEYLTDGQEPSPEAIRSGFMLYYDRLAPAEREKLKYAPIQARMEAVLHFLEGAYPTLLDRGQVASRLGYSLQALQDVLKDSAPLQSHLLKRLAGMVGLSLDYFVRGDFFGGVVSGSPDISPAALSEYYDVVQEAITSGISPGALRKAVRILAVRDQEE